MTHPNIIAELEAAGFDPADVRRGAMQELQRRKRAKAFSDNPFAFLKYVCTPEHLREFLNPSLHGGGLAFVNGPKKRKLILWPRGHLKSTTFTQAEALRRAVKNPNIRILISSMKWDNAKTYLAAIKGILQTPEFVDLYGNLLPPPNSKYYRNNDAELTLLSRTNRAIREATFSTTGIDKEKTGQHYDLIIHDDVIGRDNVSNKEQLEKAIQYYRDSSSLLDPKREMWLIGTRWHPLDLYGFIMDGATDARCRANDYAPHVDDCSCRFAVSIRQLMEEGKYIFPEIFDDEQVALLKEADQLDVYSFACQYYNNPADPSVCWFKESDVKASEIDPADIRKVMTKDGPKARTLTWYAAIDPAESTSSKACLSAAVVVGIDHEDGMWYVDWAEGRRVETPGFLDLCMETYRRYRPTRFGMETHTKKSLEYSLKRRMLDDGMLFTIEELKPQKTGDAKRTKEDRIKRLLPLFENHKIRISSACKDLLTELYTIPASRTVDLTDALSYILDMVPPGLGAKHTQNIRTPKHRPQFAGTSY